MKLPPTELSDSASSIFSMDMKSAEFPPTLGPSTEPLIPSPVPSSSSPSTLAAFAGSYSKLEYNQLKQGSSFPLL